MILFLATPNNLFSQADGPLTGCHREELTSPADGTGGTGGCCVLLQLQAGWESPGV